MCFVRHIPEIGGFLVGISSLIMTKCVPNIPEWSGSISSLVPNNPVTHRFHTSVNTLVSAGIPCKTQPWNFPPAPLVLVTSVTSVTSVPHAIVLPVRHLLDSGHSAKAGLRSTRLFYSSCGFSARGLLWAKYTPYRVPFQKYIARSLLSERFFTVPNVRHPRFAVFHVFFASFSCILPHVVFCHFVA